VVAFRTSGSADQNAGPHDSSLSCRAPPKRRSGQAGSAAVGNSLRWIPGGRTGWRGFCWRRRPESRGR
jgi:hypothetical protein